MTARSRPEDIEYISRLKFGSQFSYTPEHHAKEDIDVDNYFHNVSSRYFAAGDEIRVNIKHEDKSWSKRWYEVLSITPTDTVIEPTGPWQSFNKPKKATKPAPIKKAA